MNTVLLRVSPYRSVSLIFVLSLVFLWNFASTSVDAAEKRKHYNRLIHEKSPYLLQHTSNPIWWYPWGDEAFQAARDENKPIFLSIGYSTCHWCHVMEGDSFEKEEVAAILNEHFIAIKVDREERPDVDQIYMSVLQAMKGSGGWPITMFLTPEGVPFMGATFVPRAQFMTIMQQINQSWKTERHKIEATGKQVTAWLDRQQSVGFANAPLPDNEAFQRFFVHSQATFDSKYGGFGQRLKFPNAMQLGVLLRIHKRTGNPQTLAMVQKTLDAMARGGIYDQLGGGFHRYSTDEQWHIPHFEKMLYSQALLAVVYLEAYQITQNPEYAQVARGILEYVRRDMTHPQGGFYSAEDADSEKTEGKFYVWSEKELKRVLAPKEFARIAQVYNVTAAGNFNPEAEIQAIEEEAGLKSVKEANAFYVALGEKLPGTNDPILNQAQKKLMDLRAKRIRPHLDDKILTAWNGLMITAMAKAYQVLGDTVYLDASHKAAHFVLNNLRTKDGKLFRRWRDGHVQYDAYLNDYAFLIQALLTLYQSDFDPMWVNTALALQKQQDANLWDEKGGGYYFTNDTSLLQRNKGFADNALPSGNAVSALNLLQIADLTLQWEIKKKAARIVTHDGLKLVSSPVGYSQMMMALDYLLDRSKEVAVIGNPTQANTQAIIHALQRRFLPNKVLAVGPPVEDDAKAKTTLPLIFNKPLMKGKPTAYVCENNICQLPTGDLKKIEKLVDEHRPYAL